MPLRLVDHPLAKHALTGLRNRDTDAQRFRQLAETLSTLLIIGATRDLALQSVETKTPLEATSSHELADGLALVPVLRAGLGMLEPALRLFPDVTVGYVGLERSHQTAVAESYYCKLPPLSGRFTVCCDPMLATGGSASQALRLIKSAGAPSIAMVCVVAAPEGVAKLEADHPDVTVFTAALDRGLDVNKYILPGLGDFGDRLYGTV